MEKLEFDQVGHSYREGSLALTDVALSVAPAESVAIIGPSGCGKSTLLLMAAGLLSPSQGRVLVDGSPVAGPRQQTALILQDLGLLPWKTVRANVELGLRLRHLPRTERRDRAGRALASVGLADVADHFPAELSGGMRQRVAIARSLALDCDLLLMDEPMSALDEILREQTQDMLLGLWQAGRYAQLLVTHSVEEAVFLAQRVVVMTPHPGRVAAIIENPQVGTPGWRASDPFYAVCRQVRAALAGVTGRTTDAPAGQATPASQATPSSSAPPEGAGLAEGVAAR